MAIQASLRICKIKQEIKYILAYSCFTLPVAAIALAIETWKAMASSVEIEPVKQAIRCSMVGLRFSNLLLVSWRA